MFQFPAFPFFGELPEGKDSHSGIPGSTVPCTYPGLIAAWHALLRPLSLVILQMVSAPVQY